ncbi:Asp-tRNA(Asn)/Glu-tRNA(Gln) amidotransferase subunit GatC [bacterium]|nr:Asp-tRNA(Asn)/Glu-tRNA(Gln) amidotransferase subunit GatC [bacterium]
MAGDDLQKVDKVERIDRDRVRHVALLSRLELSDDEVERYSRELTEIVGHLNLLAELDLDGVEPTSHAIPTRNVFRTDVPSKSLAPGQALANAPEQEDDCFKVPQII